MENRYKIILSGNQIYKEAELPADMERVTVGTGEQIVILGTLF